MIRVSVPVLLLLVSGATAGLGPSLVPGAPLLAHLDLGRGAHISPVPTHKTALLGWGKNEGAVIVAPPVFTPDPEQWFNATPGLNASRSLVGLAGNPPPLLGPAMAQGPGVDGAEFVNVLFGGTDPATGTYSDQTWVYVGVPNGSAPSYWTNVTRAPNAPPAVANASLDYDAGIGQFVLFGGIQANGELSGQTWFLNERTWKWSNETAVTCAQYGCPNSRESASMGYASDLLDLYTFVFGGCENAGCTRCFNDTWYLEPEGGGVFGWIRATTPSAPSPRYSAPLAFAGNDSAGGLLLFGGCTSKGFCGLNDTWYMVAGLWTNETTNLSRNGSPTPPGRFGASMTYRDSSDSDLLTGGGNASVPGTGSTWDFDCTTGICAWANLTPTTGGVVEVDGAMPGNTSFGDPMVFGGAVGPLGLPTAATWELQAPTNQTLFVSDQSPEVNETFQVGTSLQQGPAGDREFGTWNFDLPFRLLESAEGNSSFALPVAGSWYVNGTAIDLYDYSTVRSFPFDVVAPRVLASAASATTDVGIPENFTAQPIAPYRTPLYYAWGFGDAGTAGTQNATHAYGKPENYTATVQLLDGLNNVASAAVQVTVLPRPTLNLTASSITAPANRSIAFTAHLENGTPGFTYRWDFGDGSSPNSSTAPTHAFARPGSFPVTLVVTDAVGARASATVALDIVAPLSATFSANITTAPVGGSIQFDAQVAGGVGPFNFTWQFGDAAEGFLARPVHTFWAPGNYSAVVWVNDSAGESVPGEVSVTVTAPPGGSSGPSGGTNLPGGWALVAADLLLGGVIGAVLLQRWRGRRPRIGEPVPA